MTRRQAIKAAFGAALGAMVAPLVPQASETMDERLARIVKRMNAAKPKLEPLLKHRIQWTWD